MEKLINIQIKNSKEKFKLFVDDNFTINNVKQKISKILDINFNHIRLYPIYNGVVKTGFSYYGLQGDVSFLQNYNDCNDFIVIII